MSPNFTSILNLIKEFKKNTIMTIKNLYEFSLILQRLIKKLIYSLTSTPNLLRTYFR